MLATSVRLTGYIPSAVLLSSFPSFHKSALPKCCLPRRSGLLHPACIHSSEVSAMQKRKLIALAAVAGMLAMILDSRIALSAAAEGVQLCISTVIPSLFPFLFLSGIFGRCFTGMGLPGQLLGVSHSTAAASPSTQKTPSPPAFSVR